MFFYVSRPRPLNSNPPEGRGGPMWDHLGNTKEKYRTLELPLRWSNLTEIVEVS